MSPTDIAKAAALLALLGLTVIVATKIVTKVGAKAASAI